MCKQCAFYYVNEYDILYLSICAYIYLCGAYRHSNVCVCVGGLHASCLLQDTALNGTSCVWWVGGRAAAPRGTYLTVVFADGEGVVGVMKD